MKFALLLFFVLITGILAVDPKPEPESSSNGEGSRAPQEDEPGVNVPEGEVPSGGRGGRPKCGVFFTKLFGNRGNGEDGGEFDSGRFFNRFFGNRGQDGTDNGRFFGRGRFFNFNRDGTDNYDSNGRRSYNPVNWFRNRGYGGRGGGYNPTNDNPDSRDVEFVRS